MLESIAASKWKTHFGIANVEEIIKLVDEFRQRSKKLKPSLPRVNERAMVAFRGIGRNPKRVSVVSVEETESFLSRFPRWYERDNIREFWLHFAGGGNIKRILNNIIHEPTAVCRLAKVFSHESAFSFQHSLYHELGYPWNKPLSAHPESLIDWFDLSFVTCLESHIFCLTAGIDDEVSKIARFTELFSSGNWPVGIGEDEEALVLVR